MKTTNNDNNQKNTYFSEGVKMLKYCFFLAFFFTQNNDDSMCSTQDCKGYVQSGSLV